MKLLDTGLSILVCTTSRKTFPAVPAILNQLTKSKLNLNLQTNRSFWSSAKRVANGVSVNPIVLLCQPTKIYSNHYSVKGFKSFKFGTKYRKMNIRIFNLFFAFVEFLYFSFLIISGPMLSPVTLLCSVCEPSQNGNWNSKNENIWA